MYLPVKGTIINDLRNYAKRYMPDKDPKDVINILVDELPLSLKEEYSNYTSYELAWICLANKGIFKHDFVKINKCLDYLVYKLLEEFGATLKFKGGYLLSKLLADSARQTVDVDFSISDETLYEKIKIVLKNVGDYFIEKGFIDYYEIEDTVTETRSGGITFYRLYNEVLGCDIGLHDTAYGIKTYNINIGTLEGFTYERMLADKINAILSKKRFRRAKDLYDFQLITENVDIDMLKLKEFLNKKLDTYIDIVYPFTSDILREYKKAYDKLTVISVITHKTLQKPSFEFCLNRFYSIFDAIYYDTEYTKWSSSKLCLEV